MCYDASYIFYIAYIGFASLLRHFISHKSEKEVKKTVSGLIRKQ